MKYLVDANVLSEPTKQAPSGKVVDWLSATEPDLFVDPIILGELRIGVLALPPGRKRRKLEAWFGTLVQTVQCVAWDAKVSGRWARLVVDLKRKGQVMPLLDGMIAATALEYEFTVATRNTRDFAKAGVKVFDPFA